MNDTKTTSQSSTSEPWPKAQPVLEMGLNQAKDIGGTNDLFNPYPGSNVVQYDGNTQYGANRLQDLAGYQSHSQGITGKMQDVITRGGYTEPQEVALGQLRQTATNPFDITADPAYMRMRGAVADDVENRVGMRASSAGRYGSTMNQNELTRTLGDTLAGMDVGQLTRMQGRQDAATQNLFNAGQQGFSNMGAAYDASKAPLQDLMGIGAMNEDLATRSMNADIARYDAQQNAPLRRAEWLMGIGSGAGSLGGSRTETAQQPGQSPLATALGYGTGLASLFG